MKKYFLYRTVNQVNQRAYVGVHHGYANDTYLGSGILLKKAIAKYGRENFIRENLDEFETKEEAFLAESRIVTEKYVNDPHTYNVAIGGCGGDLRSGQTHTEEAKNKMRKAALERGKDPAFRKMLSKIHKGKTISEKHKKAISKRWKGQKRNFTKEHIKNLSGKNNGMFQKSHSDEARVKISAANKSLKWTFNPLTGEQKRRKASEKLPGGWKYGRRKKSLL